MGPCFRENLDPRFSDGHLESRSGVSPDAIANRPADYHVPGNQHGKEGEEEGIEYGDRRQCRLRELHHAAIVANTSNGVWREFAARSEVQPRPGGEPPNPRVAARPPKLPKHPPADAKPLVPNLHAERKATGGVA